MYRRRPKVVLPPSFTKAPAHGCLHMVEAVTGILFLFGNSTATQMYFWAKGHAFLQQNAGLLSALQH
jgi:hypothetical protein